jgi:Protein of unknown function (DUF4058)
MPLLDHFHQPTKKRYPWSAVNAAWGVALMGWLNRHLPRDEYRAVTNIRLGSGVEADVAEFKHAETPGGGRNGAVTTAPAPPAVLTVSATFPEEIEIEIREEIDGDRLVAVIELVSPANKKELDERESFVAKCVSYLRKGIGLVIIDVVTERHANLHNELMRAIGGAAPQLMADSPTYVSGYRPVHRRKTGTNEIEVWPYPAVVGQLIPAVPLGLRGGPVVLLDLEATYTTALEATGL